MFSFRDFERSDDFRIKNHDFSAITSSKLIFRDIFVISGIFRKSNDSGDDFEDKHEATDLKRCCVQ